MHEYRSFKVGDVTHHEWRELTPQGFIGPSYPEGVVSDKKFIIHGSFYGVKHQPTEDAYTNHYFKITRDIVEAPSLEAAVEFVYRNWEAEARNSGTIAQLYWNFTGYQELPVSLKTKFHTDFKNGKPWED